MNPYFAATEQDKKQLVQEKFCQKVYRFSLEVARAMKDGESARSIIDDFGGINTADPVAVSVVYFVYSYRGMRIKGVRHD